MTRGCGALDADAKSGDGAGVLTQIPSKLFRREIEKLGGASLPVCMAKTHLSLSDDPTRQGRPRDFDVTVRELRLSAGAGFVVALTGDIMTMPGLPKVPASRRVRIEPDGRILGLMQGE
jgi:formate--tetrahydrofolate ligase